MAERISFDTTFLIDLQRERRRGIEAAAHALAEARGDAEFCLSATALGEFAAGFSREEDAVLTEVRRRFRIVPIDEGVSLVYRRIYRALKARGELIGANDLWIAAASIHCQSPLATRNINEFRRIPDLSVLPYDST